MKVTVQDDFSLSKIADSGQCFRVKEFPGGVFRFIFRDHILYISRVSPTVYNVSCGRREWNQIWRGYFDLDTDYAQIAAGIDADDRFLKEAAAVARGVRILRQDPWEMLITFIISQRKSIPAIKGAVELLCSKYGSPIHTPYEDTFLFPTAAALAGLGREELLACKLGYRVPYVQDAAHKIASGELDLDALASLPDPELFQALKSVKGVGDKVANCICLFGYHRTASAPVDVWISRVIDEYYGGANPFSSYGSSAGIMQQFMFYYMQAQKAGRI